MGRKESAIAGGLLVGVGDTLTKRHETRLEDEVARRDAAIRRLRDEGLFEHQRGLLASTQTDEGGNVRGITRGGQVTDLGFKALPKATRGESGMSAGDKRIWDAAKALYTTEDLSGEHTDWAKVAKKLREQGKTALASLADPGKDSTSTIDVNSDQYLEAQRMADEWISEQTTVFGRDKTELADYGGNRAQALQSKTTEFYEQLTGTKRPSSGTKRTDSGTKSADSGTKPNGSGTESDPYRATSQSDVDWFKANAAAGTVIEVDGKLYKK